MVNDGVLNGLKISGDSGTSDPCIGCIYGKSHEAPIPRKGSSRSLSLLELVHSDILGPVNVPSLGGSRCFIIFIDEFSQWTTMFLMKNKSDCFECSKKFQKYQKRIQEIKCSVSRF